MRIEVSGKNYTVSDRAREHAETKGQKLLKYFDRIQLITFRLEKLDKTSAFHVECIVDVEKHADFVANAEGDDLFLAIDDAVNKATRQVTDFKERLKTGNR